MIHILYNFVHSINFVFYVLVTGPIFEGAARRWFIRNLFIASALGLGIGEAYRQLYVIPARKKRIDFYRENYGIDYEKLL